MAESGAPEAIRVSMNARREKSPRATRRLWPVENLQNEERSYPAASVARSFPPYRKALPVSFPPL